MKLSRIEKAKFKRQLLSRIDWEECFSLIKKIGLLTNRIIYLRSVSKLKEVVEDYADGILIEPKKIRFIGNDLFAVESRYGEQGDFIGLVLVIHAFRYTGVEPGAYYNSIRSKK